MSEKIEQGLHTQMDTLGESYAIYHSNVRANDVQMRTVGVGEHLARIFGFKRHQSLYGEEGDHIADRFPERGWDWTGGACKESEPAFISISRTNELIAYMILYATMAIITLVVLYTIRITQPTTDHSNAPLGAANVLPASAGLSVPNARSIEHYTFETGRVKTVISR